MFHASVTFNYYFFPKEYPAVNKILSYICKRRIGGITRDKNLPLKKKSKILFSQIKSSERRVGWSKVDMWQNEKNRR
jgi:hypothetical protein